MHFELVNENFEAIKFIDFLNYGILNNNNNNYNYLIIYI